jgi:hypothetical protein
LKGGPPLLHQRREWKRQFVKGFNKEFGDRFLLVKTSDALQEGYFGEGPINPHAKASLGDYLAIATEDQLSHGYENLSQRLHGPRRPSRRRDGRGKGDSPWLL